MARLAPVLLVLAACGASSSNRSSEVLAGLPARTDPALDLADDTDLERARGHFEALPLDAPERAASRKRLWEAYRVRVTRSLASDRERAFTVFARAIGMWDARALEVGVVGQVERGIGARRQAGQDLGGTVRGRCAAGGQDEEERGEAGHRLRSIAGNPGHAAPVSLL